MNARNRSRAPVGPSFSVSSQDAIKIGKIVDRAMPIYRRHGVKVARLTLVMNLTACHANGNPLDLDKLLTFDDGNLMHDVGGISRHLNRETGALENCFLPRAWDSKAADRQAAKRPQTVVRAQDRRAARG